jgi:hypothetical protein
MKDRKMDRNYCGALVHLLCPGCVVLYVTGKGLGWGEGWGIGNGIGERKREGTGGN